MNTNKENTKEYIIAKYKYQGKSNKEIADLMELSESSIKKYIKTQEYIDIYNKYEEEIHVQKSKPADVRARTLVDKLLNALEDKIESSNNPLQYIDEVKRLTDITGVAVDTNTAMNTVMISDLKTVDEFNAELAEEEEGEDKPLSIEIDTSHAQTSVVTEEDHPLTPQDFSKPVGDETPTPSQISEIHTTEPEEDDIWATLGEDDG